MGPVIHITDAVTSEGQVHDTNEDRLRYIQNCKPRKANWVYIKPCISANCDEYGSSVRTCTVQVIYFHSFIVPQSPTQKLHMREASTDISEAIRKLLSCFYIYE